MMRHNIALTRHLQTNNLYAGTFFRAAYCYYFAADYNPDEDVAEWEKSGHIPRFVINYLEHLKETA